MLLLARRIPASIVTVSFALFASDAFVPTGILKNQNSQNSNYICHAEGEKTVVNGLWRDYITQPEVSGRGKW